MRANVLAAPVALAGSRADAILDASNNGAGAGVRGTAASNNAGVRGDAVNGMGIWGSGRTGVYGSSATTAVWGQAHADGVGVMGQSAGAGGVGVFGFAPQGRGVVAQGNVATAALRLIPQSAPTGGMAGDLYVDATGNLHLWVGGQWRRVQLVP